jgi:hypothetical protein
MATSVIATKFPQVKRPKSDAERAKAYRARKRAEAEAPPSAELLIPADHVEPAPVTPASAAVTSSCPPIASAVLIAAAIGLAGVGISMNAMFAESLGSTPAAAALFLGIGLASDLAALVLPAVAARTWQAGHRGAALAGWLVWAVTLAFAVTNAVGFTALNVTAVTQARAAIVTPAVTAAQSALDDAKLARTRECASGTGKVCRTREDAVINRQAALDAAMRSVADVADPQASAAVGLVRWISGGTAKPTADDFGMLRLLLLALLPQVGGILLLVARAGRQGRLAAARLANASHSA